MGETLVCFGEGLLRLSAPGSHTLEDSLHLEQHVGGAELNVAVACARLGQAARWVSQLPRNPLGERIARSARAQGVDLSHISWKDDGRVGLYFLEHGAAPRPSRVVYDRAASSFAQLDGNDIDWKHVLTGARAFHVSGITPALGAGPRAATLAALHAARSLKVATSFDFNYRATLWSMAEAKACFEEILPLSDRLFASVDLLKMMLNIEPQQVHGTYGCSEVILSRREEKGVRHNRWAASAWSQGEHIETPWLDLEIVDRIGGGDALVGAYLARRLQGRSLGESLHFAWAYSALAHSVPGDLPLVNEAQAEALLRGEGMWVRR